MSFSSILLMVSKYYRYYLVFVLGLSILTVFANNWLIPIWGMTGAAVASFAALFIHDYGMLLFVSLKLKVHPFSWNIAKVVGVSMVLLLINYFWMDLKNPILDGICRSAVLTSIAFIIIYKFKISDELNGMVNRMLDWGRKFLGF
ncbi:MAG: polysaccharide biosynthesis C-terminal domain-containing protein [Bacteroidales bacterium]